MASERELQNLEENDDDLLNLQAQMRVEVNVNYKT